MLDLSIVIVAYNEERIIGKTLEAIAPFAGEIILVDSGSTDKTLAIAKQYKAQCHHRQWLGYAAQKNYALSLATKKWILSLDADEVVTESLAKEITHLLSSPTNSTSAKHSMSTHPISAGSISVNSALADSRPDHPSSLHSTSAHPASTFLPTGYRIPRLLYIGDESLKHGGFYPDAQLRLFQNGKGKFIERKVHESIQIEGSVGTLKSPLLHYAYTDFNDYAATLDKYAHLSAQEFAEKKNKTPNKNGDKSPSTNGGKSSSTNGAKSIFSYWRASKLDEILHPAWTFFYRYILRAGFLDGSLGLKANLLYKDYVRKKISYLRQLSNPKI